MCLRIKGQIKKEEERGGWMPDVYIYPEKSLEIFFFGALCAYDNFVMESVPQKTIIFYKVSNSVMHINSG